MGESSIASGASNLNDSHAKDTEAVIIHNFLTLNRCGSLWLLYAITLFEAGARK